MSEYIRSHHRGTSNYKNTISVRIGPLRPKSSFVSQTHAILQKNRYIYNFHMKLFLCITKIIYWDLLCDCLTSVSLLNELQSQLGTVCKFEK